jgi:endonuclease/exonuclease/phosphatase family metal-dependent hydrolase
MKIMTLNIWRYDGDWSTRKPHIIEAILAEKPDILFMQEVFDDQRHQEKDEPHQGEQLNKDLGYRHMIYDVSEQTITENKKDLNELVFDGLLCLTNMQILEHKVVRLKREDPDKHYRAIQIIKALWHGKEVVFYHAHYSNRADWSELHLRETRDYFITNSATPIILGDLNILEPQVIKKVLGDKFESSYELAEYISFPSKKQVLDYIIIPKDHYNFKKIRCEYDNCSDHCALIAEIETVT